MISEKVEGLLLHAKHLQIIIHRDPDGDAIGSATALKLALGDKIDCQILCASRVPAVFYKILGSQKVNHQINGQTQLLIILDTAQFNRTGFEDYIKRCYRKKIPILLIDHHQKGALAKYATVAIHDENVSSSAELVFQLINKLGLKITKEVANALLLGIYTDTGAFQHANTSSAILGIVAELIKIGGNLTFISQKLNHQRSIYKTHLWGEVFTRLRINSLGIAHVKVDRHLLLKTGSTIDDITGLSKLIAKIETVKLAIVLYETDQGWRGSLRSRHKSVQLRKIAEIFGGKGTEKAGGFLATKEIFTGKI